MPMPPVPLPQGLPPSMPPPQMPDVSHHDEADEPLMKKPRTDADNELMNEQEFLATHLSPVTFKLQVPDMREKTEWRCHGQSLTITLPLTDQVCWQWGVPTEKDYAAIVFSFIVIILIGIVYY